MLSEESTILVYIACGSQRRLFNDQHPCKLVTGTKNASLYAYNSKMNHILEVNSLLKSCFEFYKLMFTPSNGESQPINKDVLQSIIMLLFKMTPENILETNQKGFIRAIHSNGFFSQPSPKLIDVDSLEQEQSNNISKEI